MRALFLVNETLETPSNQKACAVVAMLENTDSAWHVQSLGRATRESGSINPWALFVRGAA